MIDIEYSLDKNEICYALLSSSNHPNILIPIKGKIIDLQINSDDIDYLIEILYFYDDIYFLNNYFYNMLFFDRFNYAHKVKLNLPNVNNVDELNSFIVKKKYNVVNNHLMTFNSKKEMFEIYNKLNYYFISLNVFNLKQYLTRKSYTGEFKFSGTNEFNDKIKLLFKDKLNESDLNIFLKDIEISKSIFNEPKKLKKPNK